MKENEKIKDLTLLLLKEIGEDPEIGRAHV